MPLGPLVNCERFRNVCGTISPKPERHDREVIAAQPQRRRAEQDAEERRDRRRDEAASTQNGMWMPNCGLASIA